MCTYILRVPETWLPEQRFGTVAYYLELWGYVRVFSCFYKVKTSSVLLRYGTPGGHPGAVWEWGLLLAVTHSTLPAVARAEGEAFQREVQWLGSGICTGPATLQAPRSGLGGIVRGGLLYPGSCALLLCSVALCLPLLLASLATDVLMEGEEVGVDWAPGRRKLSCFACCLWAQYPASVASLY